MWDSFFCRLENDKARGKVFDFSFAKGWFIGGEGTELYKYQKWNLIMREANATNELFSGYGCSELFSAISMEKPNTSIIENVILKHNKAKDCVVVGVEDANESFVPMAFVQLMDDSVDKDSIRKELFNICETELPDYEVPKYIEILDGIPYKNNKQDFLLLEKMGNEYVKALTGNISQ